MPASEYTPRLAKQRDRPARAGTFTFWVHVDARVKVHKLPTLYKRLDSGAVQTWTIEVEGDSFRTIEGQQDGKLSTSKPTVCFGKNEGQSNETTPELQAEFEAKRKWDKQLKKSFTTDIDQVDKVESYYHPMLAHKYKDHKDDVKYPVYVQRKSDGARCVITRHGAFSRHGEPWLTIPHILNALKPIFKLYPHAIFDGELYNHQLHDDFNKIMSLIKRKRPTIDDLFESEEKVQFHCYDCPKISTLNEKDNFLIRYKEMASVLKDVPFIQIVDTYKVDDEEEMMKWYQKFLDEGYEGLMVRQDKPYTNRRTKNLLKVKPMEAEEFKILDIREGKGNKSGMAAHADFATKQGKRFTGNIKGTHEYLTQLLKERDDVLGKQATVQFQNYTPDGIPRFPYMITVRGRE